MQAIDCSSVGSRSVVAKPYSPHTVPTEAHQQQQDTDVLSVLLQQPQICQQQSVICKLLASSKQIQAVITAHCRGSVDIHFKPNTAQGQQQEQHIHFAKWLTHHANLLRSLHWRSNSSTAESAIAASLHAATAATARAAGCSASAVSGLKSCICYSAGPEVVQVTSVLPADHLTELELRFNQADVHCQLEASLSWLHFRTALQQLTSLRSLRLQTKWTPVDDLIFSSSSSDDGNSSGNYANGGARDLPISCLTNLTHLTLGKIVHLNKLHSLPQQLRQLQLYQHEDSSSTFADSGVTTAYGLQISYLSQLTHLTLGGSFCSFTAQDYLPQSLVELHLAGCDDSVCAICNLTHLQKLDILHSRTTAAVLQALSSYLTALRHVEFGYKSAGAADAAAKGWASLPIKAIDINTHHGLQAATVESLGLCTMLTRLVIRSMPLKPHKITPVGCAAQLQQLTALQELQLVRFEFQKQQEQSNEQRTVEVQEQLQRQQLYQQLNVHLRQLHLQRLQQGQPLLAQHDGQDTQRQQGTASTTNEASAVSAQALIRPDMLVLVRAIASLPQLRSVELKRIRLGNAAAELAAATHIRHIRIEECGVLDPTAKAVVDLLNSSP